MSRERMIVPPFLVSKLCPLDIFSHFLCMNRNSVTIRNMFMKLSRNVYEVKTMFGIQLFLIPVSSFLSYGPLIVKFMLFCFVIYILVHPINHSLFMISLYNLIGMFIKSKRCVALKICCSSFLSF